MKIMKLKYSSFQTLDTPTFKLQTTLFKTPISQHFTRIWFTLCPRYNAKAIILRNKERVFQFMTCKILLFIPNLAKLSKRTLCRPTDPEPNCLTCEASASSCERKLVESSLKHVMPFHQLYSSRQAGVQIPWQSWPRFTANFSFSTEIILVIQLSSVQFYYIKHCANIFI